MLTVFIATRNRCQLLASVLDRYRALQQPPGGWKLVIADNGSTDATRSVIEKYSGLLPLVSLTETRTGKNHALNSALCHAEGDLLVFSDDDAFPEPDWLLRLREAADAHPDYTVFGGRILPRWESEPPDWIGGIEDLGPIFGISDAAIENGPVAPYLVFGANMALRSSVVAAGARFDTSIGPSGSDYAMGSETELLLRLERQGFKSWYCREAVVRHFVARRQMEQAWILSRAFLYGRGRFRLSNWDGKLWGGIPRHLVRDIPGELARICAALLLRRPHAVLQHRWRLNVLRGIAREAGLAKRTSRAPFV